jgi:hypothetical protein
MTILIEDSPRNTIPKWSEEAPAAAGVAGVVLSPFTTPRSNTGYKPGMQATIDRLRDAGLDVYIDPASHVMQMPGMGDVRYYDDYDLWSGVRGDISTEASRREHIRRVFELQDRSGVPRLAPTALLHAPTSTTSMQALDLAHEAADICQRDGTTCMGFVAGSGSFWSGASLDSHIGAIAQVDVAGWFVVEVHAMNGLPVPVQAPEIYGQCRTVRALSELSPFVHVSHGDFAALPLVAAGATSVGTGSDTRQRVCAYTSYTARDPDASGGGWFQRPTLEHLCGFLTRQDADVLENVDVALSNTIVPGALHADQVQVAFDHHVSCLGRLVAQVRGAGGPEDRFHELVAIYNRAIAAWTATQVHVSPASGPESWIDPLHGGLIAYGHTEGWAP